MRSYLIKPKRGAVRAGSQVSTNSDKFERTQLVGGNQHSKHVGNANIGVGNFFTAS